MRKIGERKLESSHPVRLDGAVRFSECSYGQADYSTHCASFSQSSNRLATTLASIRTQQKWLHDNWLTRTFTWAELEARCSTFLLTIIGHECVLVEDSKASLYQVVEDVVDFSRVPALRRPSCFSQTDSWQSWRI